MKNPVLIAASSIALMSSLFLGSAAVAQGKTLHDGVYTEEQAKAGAVVYESTCKTCHDMSFYTNTLRVWNSQPLLYLWETIMGTMPQDNPGSMMFDEYTDVLAYILSEQGFPAGDEPLNHDEGMDTISIVTP